MRFWSLFTLFSSLLFVTQCPAYAKDQPSNQVDSIKHLIAKEQQDSTRFIHIINLAVETKSTSPEKSITLLDSVISLVDKKLSTGANKSYATIRNKAHHQLAIVYRILREYDKSLQYFRKDMSYFKDKGDMVNLSKSHYNVGLMHEILGAFDSALYHYQKNVIIYADINMSKEEGAALHNIGMYFYLQGNNDSAMVYYKKAIPKRIEGEDRQGLTYTYNNIGVIYKNSGDFEKAIEYYDKSLKAKEALGDYTGLCTALMNIGVLHENIDEYTKAIGYYKKSIKAGEQGDFLDGIASSNSHIGTCYRILGNTDSAFYYYNKSLELYLTFDGSHEEFATKSAIASIYAYKAIMYHGMDSTETALQLIDQTRYITEQINDIQTMAMAAEVKGKMVLDNGNFTQAIKLGLKSIELSRQLENPEYVSNASRLLYRSYKAIGNFKNALENYELHITMRDSLESESNQKEIIRQEYRHSYEKQAATDSIKSAEEAKVKDAQLAAEQAENKQHQLEAKQQEQQKYFLYVGLGLALLFGGFIFNRFRVTSKQKGIIEEQHKEIKDSMEYAKRIQNAILPPSKLVKEYLKESFILYKPKDIVAGDFYWMEHKDNLVIFAAADCTGHGVPGAMVSVICNGALNRSVREFELSDPSEILNKTREIVIAEFEKSEEEVKDGMDIALCSLEGNTLKYAGAHNPLWIIRNGEILETKANKQPIGKFDKQVPYTTHAFELEKGDSIYIFSDGYVDQFGGEKGKKFKSKAFRSLLLSIQDKSMEEQRVLIVEAFENWRGNLEQIDDVCVIGVRI